MGIGNRRILAAKTLLSALCLLFPAGVTMAQTIVQSFDGDKGPGLAVCETGRTHCGFPDMNAAVNAQAGGAGDLARYARRLRLHRSPAPSHASRHISP